MTVFQYSPVYILSSHFIFILVDVVVNVIARSSSIQPRVCSKYVRFAIELRVAKLHICMNNKLVKLDLFFKTSYVFSFSYTSWWPTTTFRKRIQRRFWHKETTTIRFLESEKKVSQLYVCVWPYARERGLHPNRNSVSGQTTFTFRLRLLELFTAYISAGTEYILCSVR